MAGPALKRRRSTISEAAGTHKQYREDDEEPFRIAAELIEQSSSILVLTGAGISTSVGIPDFRSPDGLYATLHDYQLGSTSSSIREEEVDIPNQIRRPRRVAAGKGEGKRKAAEEQLGRYVITDPQELMSIDVFKNHPEVFYSFAKRIYPGGHQPSETHFWIKKLEADKKLLRLYTQNIDTLESVAGIEKVVYCHGSFDTASCMQCKRTVSGTEIESDIQAQIVPLCAICTGSTGTKQVRPVMKPNITFFGEALDHGYHTQIALDREQVDLLIVIGTSLKIPPVKDIPAQLSPDIPQILINRENSSQMKPTVFLKGDCDNVIRRLSRRTVD